MVIDEQRLHDYLGRFVVDLGAAVQAATVLIGDKLGLYRALAEAGPSTPAELAGRTGTGERYVAEWLRGQAAGGYVSYDPQAARYHLDEIQAFTLVDEENPFFLPGAFQLAAASVRDEPAITEAFRTGAGVGWHGVAGDRAGPAGGRQEDAGARADQHRHGPTERRRRLRPGGAGAGVRPRAAGEPAGPRRAGAGESRLHAARAPRLPAGPAGTGSSAAVRRRPGSRRLRAVPDRCPGRGGAGPGRLGRCRAGRPGRAPAAGATGDQHHARAGHPGPAAGPPRRPGGRGDAAGGGPPRLRHR